MEKKEVEHLVRAASVITGEKHFVCVGSQAAIIQYSRLPPEMLISRELDIYPRDRPELADEIEGSLGERSQFHKQYGYYAHGVAPETAALPESWQQRSFHLNNPNTGGATAHGPEIHDLCCSKLLAFRDKDKSFVSTALREHLVRRDTLLTRLQEVRTDPQKIAAAVRWLNEWPPRESMAESIRRTLDKLSK